MGAISILLRLHGAFHPNTWRIGSMRHPEKGATPGKCINDGFVTSIKQYMHSMEFQ